MLSNLIEQPQAVEQNNSLLFAEILLILIVFYNTQMQRLQLIITLSNKRQLMRRVY